MKFSRQLVVSSLAVFVLSACSSSPAERRQAGEDFSYLETQSFETWKLPQGAKPEFYTDYEIPAGQFNGPVGEAVDIRPPQQLLELVPGARTETDNGSVIMWLVKEDEMAGVWSTMLDVLQERGISVRENSDSRVETDWVNWIREDEDSGLDTRYIIERFEANRRYGFKVQLTEWRQDGQSRVASQTNRERYSTLMANLVTMKYDQQQQAEAERKALQLVKQIPVSTGKDRNGQPVIIARAPYNIFWKRALDVLPQLGFKLVERHQSQGIMEVEYNEPDDEVWAALGITPFALDGKKYNLQLGDLGNRTSIAVTDYEKKAIDEAGLTEISRILSAAMQKW
ncbi:outer membrane protein assembly factor BamC [Vibrio sp. HA2012]|uniref:outer membrane protein assembly factor BamC n=1 Tax=Vibrio sp. HA2012 TaxID=1971595 RepID=UPI000C2CAA66|nr:outer membrane protein assembly factor BamC [Vibrio sp. HA2012]PJC86577.1 outer membrane protein assembly factor BamC [Vibrio sp. HA2012]